MCLGSTNRIYWSSMVLNIIYCVATDKCRHGHKCIEIELRLWVPSKECLLMRTPVVSVWRLKLSIFSQAGVTNDTASRQRLSDIL